MITNTSILIPNSVNTLAYGFSRTALYDTVLTINTSQLKLLSKSMLCDLKFLYLLYLEGPNEFKSESFITVCSKIQCHK